LKVKERRGKGKNFQASTMSGTGGKGGGWSKKKGPWHSNVRIAAIGGKGKTDDASMKGEGGSQPKLRGGHYDAGMNDRIEEKGKKGRGVCKADAYATNGGNRKQGGGEVCRPAKREGTKANFSHVGEKKDGKKGVGDRLGMGHAARKKRRGGVQLAPPGDKEKKKMQEQSSVASSARLTEMGGKERGKGIPPGNNNDKERKKKKQGCTQKSLGQEAVFPGLLSNKKKKGENTAFN